MRHSIFMKGAAILTITGLCSRIIGFFYRILLSRLFGAEGLGIYQLIFPVQAFFLACSVSGFQLSISRNTAACKANHDMGGAVQTLLIGCSFSFFFSCIPAFLLLNNPEFWGIEILKEPQTIPLLKPLALSLPLCAIHSCINSFYYGQKKTLVPSLIQLAEQGIRVLSVCVLCKIILSEGNTPSPVIALYGILISEVLSVLCSVFAVEIHLNQISYSNICKPVVTAKKILRLSAPVTVTRVLITLLSSIEVILIPWQLQKSGMAASASLSLYGTLTGMAMPLLLFPTTITNSIATMLLPSITELQVLSQKRTIHSAVAKITKYIIFFGCLCCLFYFFAGKKLGIFLFHDSDAGSYLQVLAFICPFLYFNSTFSSVLHGLDFAGTALLHNSIAIIIRLSFVVFLIPSYGIIAYLWGILFGELSLFFLNILFFYRHI